MGAPNPLITVEPLLPATNSHPGPVYEYGEGVFQTVLAGKYDFSANSSLPVKSATSSSQRSSTRSSNLSIYYQNVRGLRTKIVPLRLMLSSCDYDVLVLTETWVHDDIANEEISSDFSIFRCDRNAMTSQHSRGGGVLIAVKRNLCCEVMSLPICVRLEQIAVRVKLQSRSLYIIAIYLPPSTQADLYSVHTDAVQHVTNRAGEDDVILSLGDFNLRNLQWHLDDEINGYIPSNISSDQEKKSHRKHALHRVETSEWLLER